VQKQRSIFDTILSRAIAGDEASGNKVCDLLVDRLCYVPALATSKDGASFKVSIYTLPDKRLPLFTSKERYKAWLKERQEFECLELLGGDMCLALPSDTTVVLDLECESEYHLSNAQIERIKVLSSKIDEEEDDYAMPLKTQIINQEEQKAPERLVNVDKKVESFHKSVSTTSDKVMSGVIEREDEATSTLAGRDIDLGKLQDEEHEQKLTKKERRRSSKIVNNESEPKPITSRPSGVAKIKNLLGFGK
jgi:hypothetical protein